MAHDGSGSCREQAGATHEIADAIGRELTAQGLAAEVDEIGAWARGIAGALHR